jgi:hypothetical protein
LHVLRLLVLRLLHGLLSAVIKLQILDVVTLERNEIIHLNTRRNLHPDLSATFRTERSHYTHHKTIITSVNTLTLFSFIVTISPLRIAATLEIDGSIHRSAERRVASRRVASRIHHVPF